MICSWISPKVPCRDWRARGRTWRITASPKWWIFPRANQWGNFPLCTGNWRRTWWWSRKWCNIRGRWTGVWSVMRFQGGKWPAIVQTGTSWFWALRTRWRTVPWSVLPWGTRRAGNSFTRLCSWWTGTLQYSSCPGSSWSPCGCTRIASGFGSIFMASSTPYACATTYSRPDQ